MSALTIVTAPAVAAVSTADLKVHFRVDADFTAEDAYIAGLGMTAIQTIERLIARRLINQTWKLTLECWPEGDEIKLPIAPVSSITSIVYTDAATPAVAATLASTSYLLDTVGLPPRVKLRSGASWPVPSAGLREVNAIVVTFVAGYGAGSESPLSVPAGLVTAVKMLALHLFENREVATIEKFEQLPMGLQTLLAPFRWRYQR